MGLPVLPYAGAAQVLEPLVHLLLQREPGRLAVEGEPDGLGGDAGEVGEVLQIVATLRGEGEGPLHRALAVGQQETGVDTEEALHTGRVTEPEQSGARVEGAQRGPGCVEVVRYGGERPLPAVLVAAGGAQPQEALVHALFERQLGGRTRDDPWNPGGFDPGEVTQPRGGQYLGRVLPAPLRQLLHAMPERGEIGSGGGSHRLLLRKSTRRSRVWAA